MDTIETTTDLLELSPAAGSWSFIELTAWKAILVDGDRSLRIWTDDRESHLGFAPCDAAGYPTGADRTELSNPSRELIAATLDHYLSTLVD